MRCKLLMLLVLISIVACSKEEEKKENLFEEKLKKAEIKVEEKNGIKKVDITDLYTSNEIGKNTGVYLKFNLEKATWVTGDDWDIAFYNRSIIVNGGEITLEAPYSTVSLKERGIVPLLLWERQPMMTK